MKKNVMILAILCCVFLPRHACPQIRLGVLFAPNYGGVNIVSHQEFDGGSSASVYTFREFLYRYSAGVVADLKLGKVLRFRPNLIYTRKGFLEKYIEGGNVNFYIEKHRFDISYLEAPLNIIYGTSVGKGKAFIGAGPYVAYGLKATLTVILPPVRPGPPSTTYPLPFNKADAGSYPTGGIGLNRINYGLNSLMGYETNFGLFFDFRYELGINDVFYKPYSTSAVKYNYFQLSAGFMLNRKR